MTRHLAAIMYTDIEGYTPLAQKDEPAALRLLRAQERLVRGLLEVHQGRLVKSMGDGLLIEFANALDAVECAVDLQRHIQERNARDAPPDLRVRIGIHLGDVEEEGADILGDSVNVASRIEPLAEPGGVCLSEPVYSLVHNKVSFRFESLGARTLKGVQEPVGVYRLAVPERATIGVAPLKTDGPPRMAVLPLVNLSHDPENEYFADGMTEELISVISQVKSLRVISRTSVVRYKSVSKPVTQIGAELGVDSVLEGSVRKAGNRLRITLQLIDTKTDEHRWAKTYDRDLADVFAIQAEVAEETASALKLQLRQSERGALQERPTSSLEAYESYLRGVQASRRFLDLGGYTDSADREAVKHFEAAISADPKFSSAYSYLATHLIGAMGQTRTMREVVPRARELVAKALELNQNSHEARLGQGNLAMQADHDWKRAEAEFQQAIDLNPSGSAARCFYAYLLLVLQRLDEANAQLLGAIEQDPLWEWPKLMLATAPSLTGDWESTIPPLEELARRFPESGVISFNLAISYARNGRADEALRLVNATGNPTEFRYRLNRAVVRALLGELDELRALVKDWEQGRLTEPIPLTVMAVYYARLGEGSTALSLLEKDYREGAQALWDEYQMEDLDSIRDDPRFVRLLSSMQLPSSLARPRVTSSCH